MSEAISPQQLAAADRAAARLQSAVDRHTGWDLEADMREVHGAYTRTRADRDRLAARVAELEGNWRAIQGWTRSNLQTLDSAQRDWRQSSENAAKQALLGDLSRCMEHLTEPQPAAAPDRAERSQQ